MDRKAIEQALVETAAAINGMNDRLLRVEGASNALRHAVWMLMRQLDIEGAIHQEATIKLLEDLAAMYDNVEVGDEPSRKMLAGGRSAIIELRDLLTAREAPATPFTVIKGGRSD